MSLLMLQARPPDTIRNSAANTFSFLQDAHTHSRAVSTSTHTNTHRTHTHTHTRLTTRVSRYQKGKTSLDFTEARDSEWQWHQLGHMQVCTSLQTDNHASTPPLGFYRPDALPAAQPTASNTEGNAIGNESVPKIIINETIFFP